MLVIATAGHVDHGKSTLIRALTGMEPDRWAEERRRGLTIDLGYAWADLDAGLQVAFVDVPGHERFVGNMLAGVGPVPAVLFVVAADEGWMPQSAEHLAAVDALGVQHGILAVTRIDREDPQRARGEALEHLEASSLGTVRAVCVSVPEDRGVGELRDELSRLAAQVPPADPSGDVRLWIDRAFSIRGAGTVVTGTLQAGTVRVDDELELASSGERVRVKSLESLKEPRGEVSGVARVALNLRHVPLTVAQRGDALLTPGAWRRTSTVDVRLRATLPDVRQVLCHVGSAAVTARVRPLGPDTARLQLAAPLALRIGDRLLLREPGSRTIVGAVALDVLPPPLGGRAARLARTAELGAMGGVADPSDEIQRRKVVHASTLRAMGAPTEDGGADGWYIDPRHLEMLRARLADEVRARAALRPLDIGIPVDEARRICELPERELVRLVIGPPLELRDGSVALAQSTPIPEALREGYAALDARLRASPFDAPDADELDRMGLGRGDLSALVQRKALITLGRGVYLLPGADEQAAEALAGLPQPFTASQARTALQTTRRVIIPLLEYLDREGSTRRIDAEGRRTFRRLPGVPRTRPVP
jgi:selenocysteine-specific elongation factor